MRFPLPLAALVLSCTLAPATPVPGDAPSPASPAAALRQRLVKPVTLSVREQSLSAAVDAVGKQAKVKIVVDALTIQQQLGFTPDQTPTPVSLNAKDVPLRTALRRMLETYRLDFAVVGDCVVVSTEEGTATRQLRQHVGVDFDGVELSDALRRLARDTGAQLVVDPRGEKDASAKVTLRLEDVPLETAVRLLAEMAGLKPVRVGNVLFVTSKAVAAEMRQEAPAAPPPGAVPMEVSFGNGVPVLPFVTPLAPPGVPPAVLPAVRGDPR